MPVLAFSHIRLDLQGLLAQFAAVSFRAALQSLTKIVAVLSSLVFCLSNEAASVSPSSTSTGWIDPRFDLPGTDGSITSIEDFNGQLYIAGNFTRVAGVPAIGLARWTGSRWAPVDIRGNWQTHAAAISGGNMFLSVRSGTNAALLRWDGINFETIPLPKGYRGAIEPMVGTADSIYVQLFPESGQQGLNARKALFKWDGEWSFLAETATIGGAGAISLAVVSTNIYAAGLLLDQAHPGEYVFLGRLQGTNWARQDVAFGNVYSVASDGKNLFAMGNYQTGNGALAIFDGTSWTKPTIGPFGEIESLTSNPGEVLASELNMSRIGLFEEVNSQTIASYIGTNRSEVAQGHVAGMIIIRRVAEGVIAAGSFRGAADVGTGNLALWNGTNWSRMGAGAFLGLDNEVRCLAIQGSNIVVGGEFQYAGDIAASYIALWNGHRWSSLGNGLPEPTFAVATQSNEVVALCSRSPQWSSQRTTNLWHWNGSNWREIAHANLEGYLTAIADSPLGFIVAQQIAMTNFAISRWNGSSWETVVRGEIDQPILKLVARGNELIVAGQFTKIAGVSAGKIARWANHTWSTLGGGVSGEKPWEPNDFPFSEIRDVLIDGANIYVGGSFTNAGGIPATNVARWDGSRWHALGEGLPGFGRCLFESCDFPVTSLAVANGKLFAGGGFTTAYSELEGFLAVWDGTRWTNVVNSGWKRDFPYGFHNFDGIHVRSLVALGNQLFFGGNFSSVGPVPSFNFGILHDEDAPELSVTQDARNITISWPATFSTATLQKSDSLNDGSWTDLDISQATTTEGKIELEVKSESTRSFYRLRVFQ